LIDQSRRAQRTPRSGISSLDTHGHAVRRWRNVAVPSLIPVSVDNLELLAARWERILGLRGQKDDLQAILGRFGLKYVGVQAAYEQTKIFIAQARDIRNPGMLPVRYVLHESGRLYAEGLNLQSCKREIRHAALAGCWDIDISTCHFTIMAQMAKRFGASCLSIEEYTEHKNEYRGAIARDIGISASEAKRLINAVGYGAPRSTSLYTEIPRRVGREKAAAFFAHPLYLGIKADVDAATEAILSKHPVKNNGLINLANRSIAKTTEEGEPTKKGTLMAHLLQGVEAAALEAAVRACPSQVLLLQHDGFSSTDAVDPDHLAAAVLEETGYRLNFEVERILMPLGGLEESAAPFNKKCNEPRKPNIHEGLEPFWPCFSGTVAFASDDVPPVFPLPLPKVELPF
jgi:hypothetical protein